uniref:Leucine-rich repeat protein n=1 Tax=viral metagenome TaxID=1070528 RepID=A0A6C0H7H3_9ZZZZ
MEFNIEEYLNSLPDDVGTIDVSYKDLKYLPDLSRFKNLTILCCNNNQLISLPVLNENLTHFDCSYNKITSLPVLNKNLIKLYCANNELVSLPVLNENLMELYCDENKLRSLPVLNKQLELLYCANNELTSLPVLNEKLKYCYCSNNPIYHIIRHDILNILKKNIKIWNNFRYLYYCLKYKERLWKIRERIIKKIYHPSYLYKLTEDDDLDEKLEAW